MRPRQQLRARSCRGGMVRPSSSPPLAPPSSFLFRFRKPQLAASSSHLHNHTVLSEWLFVIGGSGWVGLHSDVDETWAGPAGWASATQHSERRSIAVCTNSERSPCPVALARTVALPSCDVTGE
eukprot:369069-Rhodomonas_salina.1